MTQIVSIWTNNTHDSYVLNMAEGHKETIR